MDAGQKKCGKWNTYVTVLKLDLVFRVDFRPRFEESIIEVLLNSLDVFPS